MGLNTDELLKRVTFEGKDFVLDGIKPSGTIQIEENGNYDVTNYANAEVNVPQGNPIEVTTDTEMTNALVEDNLGKVYKFSGTSDTYETDAIYIVSEVE